jgi:hypothetical protein
MDESVLLAQLLAAGQHDLGQTRLHGAGQPQSAPSRAGGQNWRARAQHRQDLRESLDAHLSPSGKSCRQQRHHPTIHRLSTRYPPAVEKVVDKHLPARRGERYTRLVGQSGAKWGMWHVRWRVPPHCG